MKFPSRRLAIVLIAWLPILGYPATGWTCPDTTPMTGPQAQDTRRAMSCVMHDTNTHNADAGAVFRTAMGGLSCGTAFIASMPLTLQLVTVPSPYAPVSRVLATQYAPQPLQRPPQAS